MRLLADLIARRLPGDALAWIMGGLLAACVVGFLGQLAYHALLG